MNYEAIEDLRQCVGLVAKEVCRLGMDQSEKFAELDDEGAILRIYGGPFCEISGDTIWRVVLNREIANSYTPYKAIFVDDTLVGKDSLSHSYGLVPLDEDDDFELSSTQPPIVWPTEAGGMYLYGADNTAEQPLLPHAPFLPFDKRKRQAIHANAEIASDLALLLSRLRPSDFSNEADYTG